MAETTGDSEDLKAFKRSAWYVSRKTKQNKKGETNMNIIIKSTITVCAVLAAAAAYGAGKTSSQAMDISYSYQIDYDNFIEVKGFNDQHISAQSGVELNGAINRNHYYCSEFGSNIANVNVTPNLSEGSLHVNTSQLHCYGATPPSTITLNCSANGQQSSSYVFNGSETDMDGYKFKTHGKMTGSSADCTAMVDDVTLDSPYADYSGKLNHTQYVQP